MEGAAVIEKTAEQTISIRTARQLNNLSRYYSDYRDTISEIASFAQELNIDYSAYDWAHYTALGTLVTTQPPLANRRRCPLSTNTMEAATPLPACALPTTGRIWACSAITGDNCGISC